MDALSYRTERQDSDNTATESVAAAISAALQDLGTGHLLSPATARELRRALASADALDVSSALFEPETCIGVFENLPALAKEAIVDAITRRERWEVRGYELGAWYWILLRALWRLKHLAYRLSPERRLARITRELSDVAAYGVRKAPAFAITTLSRRLSRVRGRFLRSPRLADALELTGVDPRNLAVCYARRIPQSERYRGYWHDSSRHNTVGRVLGIDLLPGADGWWFVESNAHPALESGRSALYERDPMVDSLFDFVEQHGYRHLMVLDNTSSGVDPKMERDYIREAAARGVRLTMPALPNVPGRKEVRHYAIPPLNDEGTLVVRIRPYPNSLDHMLDKKRASYRALTRYLEETGDPDLHLPPTGPVPLLAEHDPDDPFPNVVYKLPELEQGRGVYFLKVNSAEHARSLLRSALDAPRKRNLQERVLYAFTNKQGVYQAFVKSPLLENRRLYKVRAMVLLTPVGPHFLSAHRIIAGYPVPEHLAAGVVQDTRPFLINRARGGSYALMPETEEAAVKAASLAVARGFSWAAEYGFRTC